jgi:hypothetical protein
VAFAEKVRTAETSQTTLHYTADEKENIRELSAGFVIYLSKYSSLGANCVQAVIALLDKYVKGTFSDSDYSECMCSVQVYLYHVVNSVRAVDEQIVISGYEACLIKYVDQMLPLYGYLRTIVSAPSYVSKCKYHSRQVLLQTYDKGNHQSNGLQCVKCGSSMCNGRSCNSSSSHKPPPKSPTSSSHKPPPKSPTSSESDSDDHDDDWCDDIKECLDKCKEELYHCQSCKTMCSEHAKYCKSEYDKCCSEFSKINEMCGNTTSSCHDLLKECHNCLKECQNCLKKCQSNTNGCDKDDNCSKKDCCDKDDNCSKKDCCDKDYDCYNKDECHNNNSKDDCCNDKDECCNDDDDCIETKKINPKRMYFIIGVTATSMLFFVTNLISIQLRRRGRGKHNRGGFRRRRGLLSIVFGMLLGDYHDY